MKKTSNKLTNTKKAMKKTIKYFSIAALALVGAVMTGCSSSDDLGDNTQQPQQVSDVHNVETLTATVSMNAGATRALTPEGVKTFAEGDKIAVIYTDRLTGKMTKAESVALTAADIDGSNANFTVTLTDPDKTQPVNYIYPADMAKNDGSVNYEALATQDGTLETLAQNLDYCFYTGAWVGGALPTGELENELAICAFDIKNATGTETITNTITRLVVNDGANTYTITRSATDGPIYVAINPTSGVDIDYFATDGTKYFARLATDKTYEEGKLYPIGLRMQEVIRGKFSVSSTKQVYFSTGNLQATTTDLGANWTWNFAANQWDKIGASAANTSITGNKTVSANGTVDLFGWSTDVTYLGINKSKDNNDYRGATFADWGSHSDVTKTIGTGWRTLSGAEWYYLFITRSTTSGYHYCKAKVNGVFGVILLPDDWNTSYHSDLGFYDKAVLSFSDGALTSTNIISLEVWNRDFVPHGAVFLPTTGVRYKKDTWEIEAPDGRLYYWSATSGANTSGESANANRVYIDGNGVSANAGAGRCYGSAVRLVRDVR